MTTKYAVLSILSLALLVGGSWAIKAKVFPPAPPVITPEMSTKFWHAAAEFNALVGPYRTAEENMRKVNAEASAICGDSFVLKFDGGPLSCVAKAPAQVQSAVPVSPSKPNTSGGK